MKSCSIWDSSGHERTLSGLERRLVHDSDVRNLSLDLVCDTGPGVQSYVQVLVAEHFAGVRVRPIEKGGCHDGAEHDGYRSRVS